MKKLFTLLTLSLLSLAAFADKQISGVVVDENGEPIIGATIQVNGTNKGTISDYEGAFSISVPDDAQTITVSFIGRKAVEAPIKAKMRVVLLEDSEVLQDVVVTGYGNVSKGSFAGSAQAVDAETIDKKSPSELSKALAGEVAGVQVVNSSGQPGTNASIRIRGIGSIYASTTPLYIVDGVQYQGDISSIDPGDIASTTILKDATATSLYGSRGANGVIVITTKKGTTGETGKIDVDVKYGANMHLLPMYDVITDPKEYVEMCWMGIYNSLAGSYPSSMRAELITAVNNTLYSAAGLPTSYNLWNAPGSALIDGYTGKFFPDVQYKPGLENKASWESQLFRVGQKADATVRISGGSEKTSYFTSFGYLKDEGYYINSDFDRFTVRSNIDHQAKKWLKGSLNLAYTYSSMNSAGQGSNMNNGFAFVNEIPPIYPVFLYNTDGTIQVDPKTGGLAYDYGMREGSGRAYGTGINPAGSLRYDRDYTQQHQVMANAMLEFKLYEGLKLTVNVGAQYLGANNSMFTNAYYGDAAGLGRISKTQYNIFALTANELLEYNKQLGDHSIRAMVGHENNYYTSSVMSGSMSKVALAEGPSALELSNATKMTGMGSYTGTTTLDSYFANVNYIYNERYGITANYRADGSSKFAKGHRWGHFGSVGATWMFTNESFLQGNEWLKNGKLRASWGVLGNQGIGSYYYENHHSLDNVEGEPGYVTSFLGSKDITWERTSQVDIGLEFDLHKYLTAEFDYFYKFTDNLLMPRYQAPSTGFSSRWVNGGSLENQGIEFQLNIHAVDERNVKLDIRLNGGHYANKLKSLPKFANTETEETDMKYNGGMAVGHSLYEYNMIEYAGVDPTTGEALYVGYYDADLGTFGGNPAEALRERGQSGMNYISNVYLYKENHPTANIQTELTTRQPYAGSNFTGKKAEPGLDGGFGFNLEVYGVTLDVACSYRIGGYGLDGTYAMLMNSDKAGRYNFHVDMRNAWNELMTDEQKANATIPRLSNGADLYANASSTRFLISNSFLSLNNIRLGYSFQKKYIEKIKLNSLSLYVTADNLAILSARKGYNPMTSYSGYSDTYQYTPLSTIMGGVKFQF